MQECSFKPNLSLNQNINDWAVASKYQDTDIVKRLYTYKSLKDKNEKEKLVEE